MNSWGTLRRLPERLLRVAKSGASARARHDDELCEAIRAIHEASRGTYGVPRVHAELVAQGSRVSRKRVVLLMREAGLAVRTALCTREVPTHLSIFFGTGHVYSSVSWKDKHNSQVVFLPGTSCGESIAGLPAEYNNPRTGPG